MSVRELAEVVYVRMVCITNTDERQSNRLDRVYDGFASMLLDSAIVCAPHTVLEKSGSYDTSDLNIVMCLPMLFSLHSDCPRQSYQ